MKTRSLQNLFSILSLVVVASPSILADEWEEQRTAKRITHLIGTLAAKTAAPKIIGDESKRDIRGKPMGEIARAVFDKSYDRTLQVSVYLAVQQLLAEDESALDLLFKHFDDKRYCVTINSLENDENQTVGNICWRIFDAKIRPFGDELRFMTRDQWGVYPPRDKPYEEWWPAKKKLGLVKIQIEAIDAMLDFMQKADANKAVAWHPAAEKVPPRTFERRRKENIRILKAMRETIVCTGKPIRPRTCFWRDEHIIGLPW
jgi:hypothetical protein